MKRDFLVFSIVYAAIYILILWANGIVIYPVDWLAKAITGVNYTDPGYGIIVWTALVILMAVAYIPVLAIYLRAKAGKRRQGLGSNAD